MADQCPSTVGKKDPQERAEAVNGNGRKLWRSLDEYADTQAFRDFLHREFPKGASELMASSRRTFLQIMGAGLALAGVATLPGCRRPDHKIMTYSKEVPEEIVPGKPLYYATSMALPGGGAEGLLVETHEGRPTFVEGNPLHPINQGRSSAWSVASVLSLYDPDRPTSRDYPKLRRGQDELAATWDDFRARSADIMNGHDADRGAGLAFIVDKQTSPTRDAMRDRLMARFPRARWVAYDANESGEAAKSTRIAFGRAYREQLHLERADVVVSVDRNVTDLEPGSLPNARGVSSKRRPLRAGDTMSRLYAIDSVFTPMGSVGDHRVRVAPSQLPGVVIELARRVLEKAGGPTAAPLRSALSNLTLPSMDVDRDWLEAAADDLAGAGSRALVCGGDSLPGEIRALIHAINVALGATGTTVDYVPMGDEEAAATCGQLQELADEMRSGAIRTAVVASANPVFNAPGAIDFAGAFKNVPTRIVLSDEQNETLAAATWALNGTHFLESWGDTEALDGTIAPIQPMIAPLYPGALSEIELLALLAENRTKDQFTTQPNGYELVRSVWRERFGRTDFEIRWKRALHDGVLAGTGGLGESPRATQAATFNDVADAIRSVSLGGAPSLESMDVVFTNGRMYDGRFANSAWLQELPQFGTMVVWDNPALVSPNTARRLGLEPDPYTVKEPKARMATVEVDGRSVEVPVWIMPGMADNTIALQLGWGRSVVGVVGAGTGFDVSALRTPGGASVLRGAKVSPAGGSYPISSTQNHWTMQSRTSIARAVDLPAFTKHGDEVLHRKDVYGSETNLNFAEQLGELSHTPPNVGIYDNPYNESLGDAAPGSIYSRGPQWGMTIDLSTCTGCGVCTAACQSENNIPVVGKTEVRKGREMTWIRVDRYFAGDDLTEPGDMLHQPVACVHCENAPCESVCPFNATMHGPTGLNYMVYNRCVGTRYCANNCPYKVRRFNFFDFSQAKLNGGYRSEIPDATPKPNNINLIPPRLREQLDEIQKMRMNPDVTVRSRGVMEKCSYCIQRINAARYEVKLQDMENIPDGFFKTACQAACPSDAIVFGDLLDKQSEVHETYNSARSYALLGYLNTRPRTNYLVRVSNPNPAIRTPVEDPFHHGHGDHGSEGDHGGKDAGHSDSDGGHAFLDPVKKITDDGYALSLKVLSAATGAGV